MIGIGVSCDDLALGSWAIQTATRARSSQHGLEFSGAVGQLLCQALALLFGLFALGDIQG